MHYTAKDCPDPRPLLQDPKQSAASPPPGALGSAPVVSPVGEAVHAGQIVVQDARGIHESGAGPVGAVRALADPTTDEGRKAAGCGKNE
jgi:hypothetical protein